MIRTVSATVLFLIAVVRIWDLWRRHVTLWRATLDVCVVTLCVAYPLMSDWGPTGGAVGGVGFVAMTTGYAIQLVTATSARIYSRAFRDPTTTLSDCRGLFAGHAFFLALLVGGWLASPLVDGRAALGTYAGPTPFSLVCYKIGAWTWVIIALLDVGFVSARSIRHTAFVSWPGLAVCAFAFFAAASKLSLQLATILPGSDPGWYHQGLDSQPPVALTLGAGLTLLFGVPWLHEQITARRVLRDLSPLWVHLTARHPELVMPVAEGLSLGEQVGRRVIEIRDALTVTPTHLEPGAPLHEVARELAGPEPAPTGAYLAERLPAPHSLTADLAQLRRLAKALPPHLGKETI